MYRRQKQGSKAAPVWWSLLLEARKLKAGFTAQELASAGEIGASVASAWLGKFVAWGYAERAGSRAAPPRWIRLYTLTERGQTRRRPTGRMVFKSSLPASRL
jgi:hypothetical protein